MAEPWTFSCDSSSRSNFVRHQAGESRLRCFGAAAGAASFPCVCICFLTLRQVREPIAASLAVKYARAIWTLKPDW
jgi:hypothetical protein